MTREASTSGFSGRLTRLRNEISSIIAEEGNPERATEEILQKIVRRTVFDDEIVIMKGTRAERQVTVEDIIFIARKAVEQAEFDGVYVILPSGEKVNRKKRYRSFSS